MGFHRFPHRPRSSESSEPVPSPPVRPPKSVVGEGDGAPGTGGSGGGTVAVGLGVGAKDGDMDAVGFIVGTVPTAAMTVLHEVPEVYPYSGHAVSSAPTNRYLRGEVS
jgi:hypothetical protein